MALRQAAIFARRDARKGDKRERLTCKSDAAMRKRTWSIWPCNQPIVSYTDSLLCNRGILCTLSSRNLGTTWPLCNLCWPTVVPRDRHRRRQAFRRSSSIRLTGKHRFPPSIHAMSRPARPCGRPRRPPGASLDARCARFPGPRMRAGFFMRPLSSMIAALMHKEARP